MAEPVDASVAEALSLDYDTKQIRLINLDLRSLGPNEGRKHAFLLENVFSPEECETLIKLSEDAGYSTALIHIGNGRAVPAPGYRDGDRVLIDDKEFVKILFSRISSFLPQEFEGSKLLEINERLRFLRYDSGGKFQCHKDSHYQKDDRSAMTFVTLQMYINEGFEGGETTFRENSCKYSTNDVPVIPKTGMILVFQHNILHEGSVVKSGRKYTIRTDVLYSMDK